MKSYSSPSPNNATGVAFWSGEYIPNTANYIDQLISDELPGLVYIPFSEEMIEDCENHFENAFNGGYGSNYLHRYAGIVMREKRLESIISSLEELTLLDMLQPILYLSTQIQQRCAMINHPEFTPDILEFNRSVKIHNAEVQSMLGFLKTFYHEYVDASIPRDNYSDFITSVRIKTKDKDAGFTITDHSLIKMLFLGFVNIIGGYTESGVYSRKWEQRLKGMISKDHFIDRNLRFPASLAKDFSSFLTAHGKFPAWHHGVDTPPEKLVPTLMKLYDLTGFNMVRLNAGPDEWITVDKDNMRNWLVRD